jgi:hypothetical protein
LWGLLQPYAHLNAGRIASGECHWLAVGMLVMLLESQQVIRNLNWHNEMIFY